MASDSQVLVKSIIADVYRLKESALESGKISSEEFDKRVRPERKSSILSPYQGTAPFEEGEHELAVMGWAQSLRVVR